LFTATHLVRGATAGEDGSLAWFRTGAAHEELNAVLAVAGDRIPDAVRAMGAVPALWHSWPEEPRFDVEEELLGRGFDFVEEEPVMVRALGTGSDAPAQTSPAPGLRIQRVTDRAALTTWVQVWTGSSDAAVTDALADKGLGPGRGVEHLLAVLDGEPVGCAAAVVTGAALAVEHVVAAQQHRGKGVGTALTAAVLETGRNRRATTAVLTASPDGLGIYQRLGFTPQTVVRRFRPPRGEDRTSASPADVGGPAETEDGRRLPGGAERAE